MYMSLRPFLGSLAKPSLTRRRKHARRSSVQTLEKRNLLAAVVFGERFHETVGTIGDVDHYEFAVASPVKLYVDSLSTYGDAFWTLRDSKNVVIGTEFLQSTAPIFDLGVGNYSLTFDSNSETIDAYSFQLSDAGVRTPVTPGIVTNGTLNPASETDFYSLAVNAGDRYSFVNLTASPMNATWRLLDPLGRTVFDAGLGSSQLNVDLTMTGTYSLLIEGNISDTGSLAYSFLTNFVSNTPPTPFTGTPLTLGDTISSEISVIDEQDSYTFTLGADSRLFFDALATAGNISWTLTGPAGIEVNGRYLENDHYSYSGIESSLNLIAGDYQLVIDGVGDAVGAYSFRLSNLATATPLTPGIPVSGSLDPASETDAYRFNATAGERFYFDSQTATPENAYWRLLDPLGRVVANNFLGSDMEPPALPLSGTYTLLVEGYFYDVTPVDYTFNVLTVPSNTATGLTIGNVVTDAISVVGEQDSYTFTLGADSRLFFDALATAGNISWTLTGPAGIEVNGRYLENDHYSYSGIESSLNLIAGDYQLVIDGVGDAVGAYSFRLSNLATATPLTPGIPVSGSLDPASETDAYRFNATAGERFYFDSQTATPENAYWRLLDPLGRVVANNFLGSDMEPPALPLSGTYTLLVEGYFYDVTPVDYTFNVLTVPSNTATGLTIGNVVTDAISVVGEQDSYTFTLGAASRLYFDALATAGNISWTLTGPAGIEVNGRYLENDHYSYSGIESSLNLIAGDYQLVIDGVGDATGAYSFRLSNLVTATPLTPGIPVSGSLDPASETDAYRFNATAGERFYFDSQTATPENAYWRLLDPLGRVVANNFLGSDMEPPTLPLSGTYTLLVEGYFYDTTPVDYTFNVLNVPSSPAIGLTLGSVVAGDILLTGEQDSYTFTLGAASRLYFDSLSSEGNITWTLTGPAGIKVNSRYLENDYYDYGYESALSLIAGDYQLVIDGVGDATGAYSFKLSDFASATALTSGVAVSGDLNPATETDIYSLAVNAGDKFSFATATASPMNATWRLLDPLGRTVFNSGLGTSQLAVDLTMTGTYSLLIEGNISDAGNLSYSFLTNFVSNTPPTPFTGTPLTLGDTISSEISVIDEQDSYTFSLGVDSRLFFDALASAGSISWTLTGPAGIEVDSRNLENDNYFYSGIESALDLIAGDYQLVIDGVGDAVGAYSFRLSDLATATPLTPGTPVSSSLDPASETDAYQFNATAGERFYFDSQTVAPGSAYWRLLDPLGRVVANNFLGSDAEVAELPLSGTYTFLVEGYFYDATPVDYTFNVLIVPSAPATGLTIGNVVTDAISVVGERDSYTFTLGADSRLFFDALASAGSISWTLTGPAGIEVDSRNLENDYYYSGIESALNLFAGDYQLVIDGVGDAVGAYSFRLSDLATATPLTPGTPVSGSLDPASETDAYRFNATAGERFFFDSQTATSESAYWRLLDPLGRVVTSAVLGGDMEPPALALNGTYTLLVEGYFYDVTPVDYTFNVLTVPSAPATGLTIGNVVTDAISVVGERDSYTFTLGADSRLFFDALASAGSISWTLTGPAGIEVDNRYLEQDYYYSGIDSALNLIAGDYQLVIDGVGDAVGAYSFRLSNLATATPLTPGTPVSGSLDPASETDAYRFNATAGERFYFDSQTATPENAYWRLLDPLGRVVTSAGLGSDMEPPALPLSGTYTLLVEGYFYDVSPVDYTFNVIAIDIEPSNTLLLSNTVPENEPIGTLVGLLKTSDVDSSSIQTYSFVTGLGDSDNAQFSIVGHQLVTAASFNFEAKSSYSVRIRTTDNIGVQHDRVFAVNILDVNEAPTNLTLSPSSIAENAGTNTLVGTFTTTDPDAANTFTYSLVTGTGSTDNAAFTISGNTITAKSSFNFEAKNNYSVRVRTTDQGDLSFEKAFTIDITDVNENPTDLALSPASVAENAGINALVGTFTTTDPDAANTFTYSLVTGTGSTDNAAFTISGNTLTANSSFDFEGKNSYSVRVRTTDQGSLSFEKAFTIAITNVNENPTDLALSPSSVAENAGPNALVGAFTTTDPDAANTFTYSLVAGPASADNAAFTISGNTITANSSLNFEGKNSYSVRVRTTDQGGLSFEKAFTIAVTDVNENPTDLALSPSSIAENAGASALVGTLTTTDPDAANTFTYSLVAGTGSTDNAAFTISGNTLTANSSFNFEAKNSYSVRVRTTDQGGLSFEKAFTIDITDVNENPTDLALSPSSIAENAGPNALVGAFTTTDPDAANTFTYSLVAGTGSTDNAAFTISGNTLIAKSSFNFEAKNNYSIRVRSTDQGGLSIEQAITVTVTDVTDETINLDTENTATTTLVGGWTPSVSTPGFEGVNYVYTLPGTNSTATFRPTIMVAGQYEVFVKYSSHANRASNAKVSVTHADGTFSILQNQKSGGGVFHSLGLFNFEAGTAGFVRIDAAGSNGFVTADAVQFTFISDPVAVPSANLANPTLGQTLTAAALNANGFIDVTFNSTVSLDTTTIVDAAPEFTLSGPGVGTAVIGGMGVLQSGTTYRYSFTGQFVPGDVAVNFTAGSFANTNSTVNPGGQESFTLTDGIVRITLDNTDATQINNWAVSASVGGYVGQNYLYTNAGGAGRLVYTPNIPTDGSYEVFVNYTDHDSRASNVAYEVVSQNGKSIVRIDQRTGGGVYQSLGTFNFLTGTSGSVTLRAWDANGVVVGDAIQFVRMGNLTDAPTATLANPTDGSSIVVTTINGQNFIDVTFTDNSGAGINPSTITDSQQEFTLSGTGAAGVTVNGAATHVSGATYRYTTTGAFSPGAVDAVFAAGTFADLSANANIDTIASFVVTESFQEEVIVDNSGPGFTVNDPGLRFFSSTSVGGFVGSNYLAAQTGSTATATWTPTLANSGQQYQVYVRYTSHDLRATNANYVVTHDGGTTQVVINQQSGGGIWVLLGSFNLSNGSASVKLLTEDANQYVVADAVRFVLM
ncbi:hypothetical protein SH528x_005469 [Novipirellula sp. SH528]|uniref:golvesin C-terminal-like domain-containing protein n=1 Tax=Novipirellula sp. SH528 TaxID=3454466 RepID=UPI003FA035AB